MDGKKLLCAMALCLALCVALAMWTELAFAQRGELGMDKELATKKGVGGSLASKEFDKNKMPGRWKISFGIGSIILAIAVVKYL